MPTPAPVRPDPSVYGQTPGSPAAEERETFSTPDSSPVAPRVEQEPSATQPQLPDSTPRRSSRIRKPVIKFDPSDYH